MTKFESLVNNYTLAWTIVIILGVLILGLLIGLWRMYRVFRAQNRLIKSIKLEKERTDNRNVAVLEDVEVLMRMLYDLTLTKNTHELQYKAAVIRSNLWLAGVNRDVPYSVGVLKHLAHTADIDSITELIEDVARGTITYDPEGKVGVIREDTRSALEKFLDAIAKLKHKDESDATMHTSYNIIVTKDPVIRELREGVQALEK